MDTLQLPVGDFKSRFSEALEIVARGGTVGVTYGRSKKPVALLVPPPQSVVSRPLGILAGKVSFQIASDWNLTDEEFVNP